MQGGLPVLGSAVSWIASLVTGSLASAVAVLAVAWLGLVVMQGRFVWRSAARVMLGSFILFGAPVLAKGLYAAASGNQARRPAVVAASPSIVVPSSAPQFDPYAGAALPQ